VNVEGSSPFARSSLDGNPGRVRSAPRPPARRLLPARFPFGDFGICTFPTPPARYARVLALGLANPSRDGRARSARGAGVGRVGPSPRRGRSGSVGQTLLRQREHAHPTRRAGLGAVRTFLGGSLEAPGTLPNASPDVLPDALPGARRAFLFTRHPFCVRPASVLTGVDPM
jgi:hypothetical protein